MSDEDYVVRKLAGQLARLTRTVDGLSRTRQVARTIISTDNGDKTVGDILEGADEDRDNLNNLEEVVGGLEDSWSTDFDSWVDTQELIKDTVDEAHEAKMQAIESLQDAMDALDGIENLEADLTPKIEDAQGAADAAATKAQEALTKANQNIQDILTLDSEVNQAADKARDAWNKAVEAGDAAEIARLSAVSAGNAATQAQTTANGKTKLVRSTAAASGQGTTVGDVWWRFGNAQFTGPVIGQWTWSGTAWVPSTIGSEIIEALTVDKLTVTGGAKIPTAVIDTLVGDQAFLSSLYTNRVIVDSADLAPGPGGYQSAWNLGSSASFSTNDSLDVTGSGIRIRRTGNDAARTVTGPTMPVASGVNLAVQLRGTTVGTSNNGRWTASMEWFDKLGAPSGSTLVYDASANVTISEVITVPADVAFGRLALWVASSADPGDRIFRNISVRPQTGAVLIEDGAITAPKITASQELSAKVAEFIEVKAGQLVADNAGMNAAFIGQLVGEKAFFNEMLAGKMIISDRTNIVWDGNFLAYDSPAWANAPSGGPGSGWSTDVVRPGMKVSQKITQKTGAQSSQSIYSAMRQQVNVSNNVNTDRFVYVGDRVGDKLVAYSHWYVDKSVANSNGQGISSQIYFYNEAGSNFVNASGGRTPFNQVPVGSWFKVGGEPVTVPAGALYAIIRPTVYFTNNTAPSNNAIFYLGGEEMYWQTGAVLIEDGAITGDKISANAIDGKTITGALIRTSASGQRLQFDSGGLRAFDASNQVTAALYSDLGGLRLTGGGLIIGVEDSPSRVPTVQLTAGNGLEITMPNGSSSFRYDSSNLYSNGLTVGSGRWAESGLINAYRGSSPSQSRIYFAVSPTVEGDTNWANFTRASGISGTAQWRRYLGVIYVRMNITTSVATGDHVQLGTLPAAARPSKPTALNASGTAGPICTAYVDTTGIIRFRNANNHTATAPYVDGSFIP